MHRERLTSDEMDVLLTPSYAEPSHNYSAETCLRGPDTHMDDALAQLHTKFGEDLKSLLSDLTRRDVVVKMRQAARGTYGHFVFGHSIPTCCAVIIAEPIQAEFFLAIRPSLLFPLLDRLFGCDTPEPPQQRPLSEIEASIAMLLVEQILERYREVWQQVLSLELSVDRFEHNIQQMRVMRGSDPAYLVRYDIRCDRDQGCLEFCIPWDSTQQMRERLAANR